MAPTYVYLFTFTYIFTLASRSDAGFLYGAPCSTRNTLEITVLGYRNLPEEIQCVDITASGLTDFTPYLIFMKNATTLYADHMLLTRIPTNVTRVMKRLELLDLSGNRIRQIHPKIFSKHHALHTILLSDNRVLVPKSRPLLSSLSVKTLQLSGNKIRRLTPYTFLNLPHLMVLYLDNNSLKKIDPEVFKSLGHLKYLHLGGNLITTLPPRDAFPVGLMTFIVKGNPLNFTNASIK